MLAELRNQLICEIVKRLSKNGYGAVYYTANHWRAEEVIGTSACGHVVSRSPSMHKHLSAAARAIRDEGKKPAAINEVWHGDFAQLFSFVIEIPREVVTLEPSPCPHCGAKVFISHFRNSLIVTCQSKSHPRWEAALSPPIRRSKGAGLGRHGAKRECGTGTRQRWTPDEEITAKGLRAQGLTYREIADVMKRPMRSVQCFLHGGGMEGTRKRQQARSYLNQFDL